MMKVAVIGTGYVGLVSGACFAEMGIDVTCVDTQQHKIDMLQRNEIPIYEPGLEAIVARNAAAGRLRFTTDLDQAIKEAEVISIAVGTPTRSLDGFADLSYVYSAAEAIAKSLDHYAVIVTKSTVPAETGYEISKIITRTNPALDVDVASNPEFLREGNAVKDFLEPDRVVIGTDNDRAKTVLSRLYAPLGAKGIPVFHTSIISAELIKYAANTFLATKVSFINEIADLCECLGANVEDVADAIGMDSRIGSKFLKAGPGYGGSCFPKDTMAMVGIGERALSPVSIVEAVIAVNRQRQHRMIKKIIDAAGGVIEGKKIAFLGLAFKAETDDVRDSIALYIAENLARRGAHVAAYDPEAMENARRAAGPIIDFVSGTEEALRDADLMVLATEWGAFCSMDLRRAKQMLASPVIVDLRNALPLDDIKANKFTYYSVGRPVING